MVLTLTGNIIPQLSIWRGRGYLWNLPCETSQGEKIGPVLTLLDYQYIMKDLVEKIILNR